MDPYQASKIPPPEVGLIILCVVVFMLILILLYQAFKARREKQNAVIPINPTVAA